MPVVLWGGGGGVVGLVVGVTMRRMAGQTGADWSHVGLEPCVASLVAGDGRDLWRLQGNGQLVNVGAGKCAAVGQTGDVALEGCDVALGRNDGSSQWEMQGNGQWKLAGPGGLCLTQDGPAAGNTNLAAAAAVVASSTATSAHGAAGVVFGVWP